MRRKIAELMCRLLGHRWGTFRSYETMENSKECERCRRNADE